MIKSFLNRNNIPIIRKCSNCINFKLIENGDSVGYCRVMPLLFAFTHESSVYAIVKDFYLCEKHELPNEQVLRGESKEIELLPYLLERNKNKKGF